MSYVEHEEHYVCGDFGIRNVLMVLEVFSSCACTTIDRRLKHCLLVSLRVPLDVSLVAEWATLANESLPYLTLGCLKRNALFLAINAFLRVALEEMIN